MVPLVKVEIGGRLVTVSDQIMVLVRRKSGLTERELAEEIFGNAKGYQQRVNGDCRLLVAQGKLERHGDGGAGDPYTYKATR